MTFKTLYYQFSYLTYKHMHHVTRSKYQLFLTRTSENDKKNYNQDNIQNLNNTIKQYLQHCYKSSTLTYTSSNQSPDQILIQMSLDQTLTAVTSSSALNVSLNQATH